MKAKKKALLHKIQLLQRTNVALNKKQQQELQKWVSFLVFFIQKSFSLRKSLKSVEEESEKRKTAISLRRQQKLLSAMVSRKKLGRGDFKPYEEPVLLPNELTGCLRQLPSRGNIVEGALEGFYLRLKFRTLQEPSEA